MRLIFLLSPPPSLGFPEVRANILFASSCGRELCIFQHRTSQEEGPLSREGFCLGLLFLWVTVCLRKPWRPHYSRISSGLQLGGALNRSGYDPATPLYSTRQLSRMFTSEVDSPLLPIGTNFGAADVAGVPDGGDLLRDQAASLFHEKRGWPPDLEGS